MIDGSEGRISLTCTQCGRHMDPFHAMMDVEGLRASVGFDDDLSIMQLDVMPLGRAEGDQPLAGAKVNTWVSLRCPSGHRHCVRVDVNENTGGADLVIEYLPHAGGPDANQSR
jgi:hypothetical protein